MNWCSGVLQILHKKSRAARGDGEFEETPLICRSDFVQRDD
jgi:hypothetical protein